MMMNQISPTSSGIYKITCTRNGRSYIGSSGNVFHRVGTHVKQLKSNSHPLSDLQKDWNRFGGSAFSFGLIAELADEILRFAEEKRLISEGEAKTLYNKIWKNQEKSPIVETIGKIDFSNYISITQFAKLCGCTRKTVYGWIAAGKVTWYSAAPDRAHYFEKDKSIVFANQWRKRHAKATPGAVKTAGHG